MPPLSPAEYGGLSGSVRLLSSIKFQNKLTDAKNIQGTWLHPVFHNSATRIGTLSPFQRQGAQHLPPGLNQVQMRCAFGLKGELSEGMKSY